MGEKEKKRTVVILAEEPNFNYKDSLYYRATYQTPPKYGEFINQAEGWKKKHPEYNVIVKPFYKGWKGNELKDVVADLKSIDGNYDLAFMGHSGTSMGGVPISETSSKIHSGSQARQEKHRGRKTLAEMLAQNIRYKTGFDTTPAYDKAYNEAYSKLTPEAQEAHTHRSLLPSFEKSSEEESFKRFGVDFNPPVSHVDMETVIKEYEDVVHPQVLEKVRESFTEKKTVADYINIDLGDKVDNLIVGGCGQGSGHPTEMQGLSTETNRNVFCQWSGAWGTKAIKEVGDTPQEKFFVSGRKERVGGVQFSPDAPPKMIETRKAGLNPEVERRTESEASYGIKDDKKYMANYLSGLDSSSGQPSKDKKDWTLDDIDKELTLLGDNNRAPLASARALTWYLDDKGKTLDEIFSANFTGGVQGWQVQSVMDDAEEFYKVYLKDRRGDLEDAKPLPPTPKTLGGMSNQGLHP